MLSWMIWEKEVIKDTMSLCVRIGLRVLKHGDTVKLAHQDAFPVPEPWPDILVQIPGKLQGDRMKTAGPE